MYPLMRRQMSMTSPRGSGRADATCANDGLMCGGLTWSAALWNVAKLRWNRWRSLAMVSRWARYNIDPVNAIQRHHSPCSAWDLGILLAVMSCDGFESVRCETPCTDSFVLSFNNGLIQIHDKSFSTSNSKFGYVYAIALTWIQFHSTNVFIPVHNRCKLCKLSFDLEMVKMNPNDET